MVREAYFRSSAPNAAAPQTSISSFKAPNENRSFTLDVAPNKDDQKVDTAVDAGQVATTPTTPPEKVHKGPILKFLTNNGISAAGSNTTVAGTGTGTGSGTNGRPTPIKDAVKQAGSQLKGAADDVRGGLKDAADSVKKALGGDRDTDKGDASSSVNSLAAAEQSACSTRSASSGASNWCARS